MRAHVAVAMISGPSQRGSVRSREQDTARPPFARCAARASRTTEDEGCVGVVPGTAGADTSGLSGKMPDDEACSVRY
jgi:hypothetical protein